MLERIWRKGNSPILMMGVCVHHGNGNLYNQYGKQYGGSEKKPKHKTNI